MSQLALSDLQELHPAFTTDVSDVWDFERSVEQRSTHGGTSKKTVLEQIEILREWLREGKRH